MILWHRTAHHESSLLCKPCHSFLSPEKLSSSNQNHCQKGTSHLSTSPSFFLINNRTNISSKLFYFWQFTQRMIIFLNQKEKVFFESLRNLFKLNVIYLLKRILLFFYVFIWVLWIYYNLNEPKYIRFD